MGLSGPKVLLRKVFVEGTDNAPVQMLRYTLVGGVAFVLDFGSLFALTEFLEIHYLTSAGIAFLVGLGTNYVLSLAWVFRRRSLSSRSLEFGLFAAIGVIGLGLNEGFIWLFTEYLGAHYLISKLISTVLVYVWNFGARKRVLFR